MTWNLLIALLAASVSLAASPSDAAVPLFFIANHGQVAPEVRFMAQGSRLTAFFSPGEALFRVDDRSVRVQFVGASPSGEVEGTKRLTGLANFLTGEEDHWRIGVSLYGGLAYRQLYPGIDMLYGASGRNLKSEFVVAPGADPGQIRVRYLGAGEVRIDESGALVIPLNGRELREQAPTIYQDRDGSREPVAGQFALAADGTVSFVVTDYDTSLPLVIDPVLSYSTLLGGSSSDAATALAVDSTGAAYIAGFTASYNFPTANPEQNFNAGGNDLFVAKLNASGNGLVYCTYLGGSGDDRAYGIAVDSTGSAYVTGSTGSQNFPVRNSIQASLKGAKNAFVLKLNPAGNSLIFSTYLGGNGSDIGNGIAVDGSQNVYVVGDTTSITFPATAMQKGNRGGMDAFVSKLSADGSRLVYSTYLGGTSDDHGAAIAVDATGSAYVTGSTYSTDFPVANAWQSKIGGGQDAFVARLSADGNSLLFGTFLGGTGGALGYPEAGQGIALDGQGNAYVAGVTSSSDFPLLSPLQSSKRGSSPDAFVAKFNAAGSLSYSTYLGGSGVDMANAIAVDASGSAYVVGQTFSSDLPVVNAYQASSGGDYDAFFAKLSPTGNSLLSLSYLGGSGSDTATAVALDLTGSVYIAGWTLSPNFPVLNGYQSINAGNYGAFVAKINLGTPPTTVGVTPNSGTGTSQTFSFQFSDAAGASDLTTVSVLLNSSLSTANGCSVTYTRAANSLMLLTDAGAAPAGSIAPGSGSQQNTQCVLNGAGSTVSLAGNVLTLNLAIAFQQASFNGSKNVYLQAASPFGLSGWQQQGSWTVPVGPPMPVSVTPSSGSGSSQTFSFLYSDQKGYASITTLLTLINSSLSGSAGCYLLYYPGANVFYLANDTATAWLGPAALGIAGSLHNSQCTVDIGNSSASGGGTSLTVNLALSFQSGFGGTKNVYMDVSDGQDSGWQQRGSWTVPAGPPTAVSVTPSSGNGSNQTFSFVYSDTKGHGAITTLLTVINSSLNASGGCYLLYYPGPNVFYLANDAVTAWLGPVALGKAGSVQNSQCTVDAGSSSASGSGTSLTVNLALSFQSGFGGTKNVYMDVSDGQDSGWQQRGSWTVPAGPPTAVSVTPSSGNGSNQTFSFVYSDTKGHGAITTLLTVINSSLNASGGCYLLYYPGPNVFYLANDAVTAWLGPVALGTSGSLQNSQCTVNAGGSSASGNGTNLTVNLALSFQPTFAGGKNVYMDVSDGLDSGWQQRGSWTIP